MVAGIGVPELSELSQLSMQAVFCYAGRRGPQHTAKRPSKVRDTDYWRGSIVSFLEAVFCQTVRNYQSCRVFIEIDEEERREGGADGAAVLLMQFSDDLVPDIRSASSRLRKRGAFNAAGRN